MPGGSGARLADDGAARLIARRKIDPAAICAPTVLQYSMVVAYPETTLKSAARAGDGPLFARVNAQDSLALAETMVAFANSQGGEILLERAGDLADANEQLARASRLINPVIASTAPEFLQANGRRVIRLSVPHMPFVHALYDGRVLVRRGAANRPLGGVEIQRLAEAKTSGDYEITVPTDASRADFSEELIREYLEKRQQRSQSNGAIAREDLLRDINAIDASGQPTVSGLLTFCEKPQRWLPQSGIVFSRFVGATPRGVGGQAGYSRREEISGPLPRLVENAWQFVWEELAISAVVQGLEREETAEYPPFAVREAIVNAVCHRDYRLHGRRIEVRLFADRLEVISPGGLPAFITLKNIIKEHYSRNPRLVRNLFHWGYIEEMGLGIPRMIEVMAEAGQPPPVFDASANRFTVTLFNKRERGDIKIKPPQTNQRQERALQHLREHGVITNRAFRAICADVSAETLRLDLVDLVRKGLIRRIGSKKGTRYILQQID